MACLGDQREIGRTAGAGIRNRREVVGPYAFRKLDFAGARIVDWNLEFVGDRLAELRDEFGLGYCNITKCCTKVCPEGIEITDNAIIPLKERVVDRYYDPLARLARLFAGRRMRTKTRSEEQSG